jgi:hypothetical protein
MKNIIRVYYNGWIDLQNYPFVQDVTYVLYERSFRPYCGLGKPRMVRDYDAYLSKYDRESNRHMRTDVYQKVILPWIDGVDLDFLEEGLKQLRNSINPKNKFIYKTYKESQAAL